MLGNKSNNSTKHHQLTNQLPLYGGSPVRLLFQEDHASLISLNICILNAEWVLDFHDLLYIYNNLTTTFLNATYVVTKHA